MTHTYKVTGMTCGSCEAKVKSSLLMLPNVTEVEVSKDTQTATISMDKHIALSTFQTALDKKYAITAMEHNEAAEQAKSWLATYKPILLIFGYITTIATISATHQNTFHWMQAMNIFMAGFFLTFSFFKMLDLNGFAESYSMYDIIAKKIKAWAYIYAFIELGLGIAYATNFQPLITNLVTLIVMAASIIGVLQSVFNKRKIQCACLGAVFNLPMSTVTIIEDLLMIAMSGIMLITML
ncbi:MAG TPA: cation transporter [Niabella sp.]|nr:cation transporter [Niabella sp.]HQW15537.1 cation transporter [Niabella sp.]HQX20680.1 cation transporter [Niabella sp.]HRB07084.1 cation transporter [Niabella sp.]HRB28294.1 cation transporter [Niabella sp.]